MFSLAAVLYEALTGVRPFPGEDAVSVSYAVVHDEAPPPSRARPGVPPAVDPIFARGLARRPADRYASAGELAEALATAVRPSARGTSAGATATRRPQHPRPMTTRLSTRAVSLQGTVAPVLVTAFFLAAVVVLLVRYLGHRAPEGAVTGGAIAVASPAARPPGAPVSRVRRVRPPREAPARARSPLQD